LAGRMTTLVLGKEIAMRAEFAAVTVCIASNIL